MIRSEMASKIKKYLKDNGIKIGYLAKKLNRTPAEMSNILNGKQCLYADEFIEIAQILNVKPDDICKLDIINEV